MTESDLVRRKRCSDGFRLYGAEQLELKAVEILTIEQNVAEMTVENEFLCRACGRIADIEYGGIRRLLIGKCCVGCPSAVETC